MGSRLILKLHLRQNADSKTWVWENLAGQYAITQEHRYADNLKLFLSRGPSPFEKCVCTDGIALSRTPGCTRRAPGVCD